MQKENLDLKKRRTAAVPIIDSVMGRIGLRGILGKSIANERYVDAIEVLIKNVLHARSAMYRVGEWIADFEPTIANGQSFAANADFILILASDLRAIQRKYSHSRAYRVALMDIGHISENLQLSSRSAGLDSWLTASFADTAISELLGLDHPNEIPLLVMAFGRSTGSAIPAEFADAALAGSSI